MLWLVNTGKIVTKAEALPFHTEGVLIATRQTGRYCTGSIRMTTVAWFCAARESTLILLDNRHPKSRRERGKKEKKKKLLEVTFFHCKYFSSCWICNKLWTKRSKKKRIYFLSCKKTTNKSPPGKKCFIVSLPSMLNAVLLQFVLRWPLTILLEEIFIPRLFIL